MTGDAGSRPSGDDDSIEIAEELDARIWDLREGCRTRPERGSDCDPVPFDTEGQGIRVSTTCPLHGVHADGDLFAAGR